MDAFLQGERLQSSTLSLTCEPPHPLAAALKYYPSITGHVFSIGRGAPRNGRFG